MLDKRLESQYNNTLHYNRVLLRLFVC